MDVVLILCLLNVKITVKLKISNVIEVFEYNIQRMILVSNKSRFPFEKNEI